MALEEANRQIQNVQVWANNDGQISQEQWDSISKTAAFVPFNFTEACFQLELYVIVLRVVFGDDHDIYTNYSEFIQVLLESGVWLEFTNMMVATYPQAALAPALIIFYVHHTVRYWVKQQLRSDTRVPFPDMLAELNECLRKRNPRYFMPEFTNHQFFKNFIASATTTGEGRGGGGGGGGGGGDRTRENQRSKQVKNPNMDPRYRADNEWAKKFRELKIGERRAELMAEDPKICPPAGEDGDDESCLNWHFKGICNTGCRRKKDHKDPGESRKQELFEYARIAVPPL